MDLTFRIEPGMFSVRAAAVIVHRGRMLLQGDRRYPGQLVPPGGRCQLHEDSHAAVVRELREELGRPVPVGRLLWVVESFFPFEGVRCHELGFFYAAELADGDPLLEHEGDLPLPEGGEDLFLRWVPVEDAAGLEIWPEVLRTFGGHLPAHPERIIGS